jgi:hypothetical protein
MFFQNISVQAVMGLNKLGEISYFLIIINLILFLNLYLTLFFNVDIMHLRIPQSTGFLVRDSTWNVVIFSLGYIAYQSFVFPTFTYFFWWIKDKIKYNLINFFSNNIDNASLSRRPYNQFTHEELLNVAIHFNNTVVYQYLMNEIKNEKDHLNQIDTARSCLFLLIVNYYFSPALLKSYSDYIRQFLLHHDYAVDFFIMAFLIAAFIFFTLVFSAVLLRDIKYENKNDLILDKEMMQYLIENGYSK